MTTDRTGQSQSASVTLDISELDAPGVCYGGEVGIEVQVHDLVSRVFTGLVDHVDITDQMATLSLVGGQREFEEHKMGGLVIGKGASVLEVVYCLARDGGLPDHRIDIQRWRPGPREGFLVAVPLEGIVLDNDHSYADVTFSAANPAQLDMPLDHELIERFTSASAWASTVVQADTLLEAEDRGLARIDVAISALRAFGAYNYPSIGNTPREYQRNNSRARVRRADAVFTGSVVSQRRWLRAADLEDWPLLPVGSVMKRNVVRNGVHETVARALHEWRLAADALDDYTRVTHLWRSVESYAMRGKPKKRFTGPQLRKIEDAMNGADAWNSEQRERLAEMIGVINSPPLIPRFRATLEKDHFEYVEAEFDAIVSTRGFRNRLEHGQPLSLLEHRAMDRAVAVMNRILVSVIDRS